MHTAALLTDYASLLLPWVRQAAKEIYDLPGTGLSCYGIGEHGHWSMQANSTAVTAFAMAAILAEEHKADGKSAEPEAIRQKALAMLRFCLRTHHSGNARCTDEQQWGHSWISALSLERVMPGVEALGSHLTSEDHFDLKRVLISEANWLLDHYTLVAGQVKDNKPESNLWNGALLIRTHLFYPGAERAAEYLEQGTAYLLNAISLPEDATSEELFSGKPLSEWHVGNNFFASLALNHHGYLNVGYMVICLSNVAMLHFTFRQRKVNAPPALYLHALELWKLIRLCTFSDGRLLRIGGDTRVRYGYCQDYALPVWLLAADALQDPGAMAFEAPWLGQVAADQRASGDGTFLGRRCATLRRASPPYFFRLEGDKAATLGMSAWWKWNNLVPTRFKESATPPSAAWSDDYHGAALNRTAHRTASWVWQGGEGPVGLFLPAEESSMAEWRQNLTGSLRGIGCAHPTELVESRIRTMEDGFIAEGIFRVRTGALIWEGDEDSRRLATQQVIFVVLPDGKTGVLLQRAVTDIRNFITAIRGLGLLMPNDLFNGMERTYSSREGRNSHSFREGQEATLTLKSPWLNVDDRLGLITAYGPEDFTVFDPGERQIGLKTRPYQAWTDQAGGMLHADEICLGFSNDLATWEKGSVLIDMGVILRASESAEETDRFHREGRVHSVLRPNGLREITVVCGEGKHYRILANLTDLPLTAERQNEEISMGIHPEERSGAGEEEWKIMPTSALLLRDHG